VYESIDAWLRASMNNILAIRPGDHGLLQGIFYEGKTVEYHARGVTTASVLDQLDCQLRVEPVEKTLPNTDPPKATND
jgi:hypothetical protein